ncbi:MAG: hypothetical protein CL454_00820 [Acidimicrobiaceae bacterium]|nr:hypothetical protein [Acidimicrobiaceae bacterium]|tara:strand:+ start:2030 stop:2881 length:852 start_codon:yes stop_codon:yes gene_type:complete
MPASDTEKRAVRDLCIAKRSLSRLEKDAKAQRAPWTKQSKQAKEALENVLPDGTCYAVGDQYLRRDVYNRMSPIEAKAVRTAMLEITREDVLGHSEYSADNEWPVFLELLKRRINDQRNRRGEYVHLSKSKPRNAVLVPAPRSVVEIAALHEQAKAEMKQIVEAQKSERQQLRSQMQGLEHVVLGYMTRTRKDRQRVSIGDSLAGGGTVQHGFSISRKRRSTKPKITMATVMESVQSVANNMSLVDFFRNRRNLSKRLAQTLVDACQPSDQFYIQLRSSGIRE